MPTHHVHHPLLQSLIDRLLPVWQAVLDASETHDWMCSRMHPHHQYGSLNLLRYLRFRSFDLRELQWELSSLGISSMSHAERQVLANLENILYLLHAAAGQQFIGKFPFGSHPINFQESAVRLRKNTQRLFRLTEGSTALMVTLPPEATDAHYLEPLLRAGMNVARINCAHDDSHTWHQMIQALRLACHTTGHSCSILMDLAGPKVRTGAMHIPEGIRQKKAAILHENDVLLLTDLPPQQWTQQYPDRLVVQCSLPELITSVQPADPIWFDDGKIGGVVERAEAHLLTVRITQAAPEGSRLKGEKGINVPATALNLPSLTAEDLTHLDWIAREADLVGYSFVQTPADVQLIQNELAKRHRTDMGLILKIETRKALSQLPGLLLQAMQSPNVGVMTARGDLSVELGPERLSEAQEEIMWLCEAALIPNIWATQVLESMAKTGIPSRAEVTDAAMSVRAECVMLNKGPYIVQTLQTLSNILGRMEQHQYKKQGTLRRLRLASDFWEATDSVQSDR